MNDFEKRLKTTKNEGDPFFSQGGDDDSSEEESMSAKPRLNTEADVLKEKNRILMEKLFKSDKQLTEAKEIIEAIQGKGGQGAGPTELKDKKIIELAKKNRSL